MSSSSSSSSTPPRLDLEGLPLPKGIYLLKDTKAKTPYHARLTFAGQIVLCGSHHTVQSAKDALEAKLIELKKANPNATNPNVNNNSGDVKVKTDADGNKTISNVLSENPASTKKKTNLPKYISYENRGKVQRYQVQFTFKHKQIFVGIFTSLPSAILGLEKRQKECADDPNNAIKVKEKRLLPKGVYNDKSSKHKPYASAFRFKGKLLYAGNYVTVSEAVEGMHAKMKTYGVEVPVDTSGGSAGASAAGSVKSGAGEDSVKSVDAIVAGEQHTPVYVRRVRKYRNKNSKPGLTGESESGSGSGSTVVDDAPAVPVPSSTILSSSSSSSSITNTSKTKSGSVSVSGSGSSVTAMYDAAAVPVATSSSSSSSSSSTTSTSSTSNSKFNKRKHNQGMDSNSSSNLNQENDDSNSNKKEKTESEKNVPHVYI